MAFGVGLGLVLGMINGLIVAVIRVPSIVATLGTLSIYRGIDFLIAGGKQVTLTDLPPGYTDAARDTVLGIPIFVVIALVIVVVTGLILRQTRFGRSGLRGRQQPRGRRDPGHPHAARHVRCVLAVRPARRHRGRPVGHPVRDDQRDRGDGRHAPGGGGGRRRRRQYLRRVGTVVGAALGALFLGFISNALILVAPVAVLASGDLRPRHPRRGRRRRRSPSPVPAVASRTRGR